MKIKTRPYNLLVWTALIFSFIGLLIAKKENIIDIHLHDTYFVIAENHVFYIMTFLSLLVWTLYFLTKRILYSNVLTWTHVIITILTLSLLAQILYFGHSLPDQPRHYNDFSDGNFYNPFDTPMQKGIGISLSVLILGQIIFIFNLFVGLYKHLRNSK